MKRVNILLVEKIVILLSLIFLSGCGPSYTVGINSINSEPATHKKHYLLLPGNENTSEKDLEFQEYAAYIHRALKANGFVQASKESAQVIIFAAYGIGEPMAQNYSFSLPVYGQTGGGTSYFTGSSYGSGGYSSFSGSAYSPPQYGVVGSQTHSGSFITHKRYFVLDAYGADTLRKSNGETFEQVWKTTAVSRGRTNDLRQVLPVLVAASYRNFATNTKQKIYIELSPNDKRVKFIKGLIDSPK